MARHVFFSFHYDHDISRAIQVRNANVVAEPDVAGFFDNSEYEKAKKQGKKGINRMILKHLKSTTVTVVLIGTHSSERPWVKHEIEESAKRKNGFIGVHIHHLKNQNGETSARGPKPEVPGIFQIYDWDGDLDRFRNYIEEAGKRADAARGQQYGGVDRA